MREITRSNIWSKLIVSLCSIGLIILFTSCGDSPAVTPQAAAAPQVATTQSTSAITPTTDTNITPKLILGGAGPAARSQSQLVYDKKNSTLVLFGGKSFDGYLNDTWTWDGHAWTQQHPATSPGPVLDASMAYDDASGLIVLFGGCSIGCQKASSETWTWDGTTWTQQHSTIAPPPRTGASMVYDAAIGQLVLFGGYGTNTQSPLNDTWTWDGITWTQQHPASAPSARLNTSMAYDATTHTVVLFGGDDMGAPIPLLTDTWTWNGITWTRQHPATSPAVRFTDNGLDIGAYPTPTSMVWDEATRQVVLTLAGSNNTNSQEIQISWIWNGSTWLQQSTQHLPEENMSLFYSTTQRTLYAFASSINMSTFDDSLWQWTGQTWQPLVA